MRRAFYRAVHWVSHQIHERSYRIRNRAELRLLEMTIAEESPGCVMQRVCAVCGNEFEAEVFDPDGARFLRWCSTDCLETGLDLDRAAPLVLP